MMPKAESKRAAPVIRSPTSGRSARSLRLNRAEPTSIRKPSVPRSSQNFRMRSNSLGTSGCHQFRSGCSGAKRCRYHCLPFGSGDQAGPPNDEVQLLGGAPSALGSAK